MTYFIVHEDDYKHSFFEKAEEIKAEGIKKAIMQYVKVFARMEYEDDDLTLFISENELPSKEKQTQILKYTINCYLEYDIQFDDYV